MAGPWEKYQSAPKASEGPWTKFKSESQDEPPSRKAEAALEGFGEGATLGYLNNLQALAEKPITAIGNAITGLDVQADDYVTARDKANRRQQQLQEENPGSFGAGQVAGTIASSIPVARAAQGATALARAGQAARAGAVYGGLQNTEETEGKLGGLDLPQRIENSAMGALTGAGASLGTDALMKGAGAAARAVGNTRQAVGRYFKKGGESLAENATGATRTQAEKFGKGSGRYLLDNKIVGFGDDVENIAEKAGAAIKRSEDSIDSSLKGLDSQGVQVSQNKVIQELETKIADLSKDPSQSDVVKKLRSIVDDIIDTGQSDVSASTAEQTKRGFNRMAKNWQDPDKGQAGKIAYRAYRDAVEETAQAADPAIAKTFQAAKKDFGTLAPIVDAAEKRARTLNQSPLGGLLDTAAVIGGATQADDPLAGGAAGLGAAILRRKVSPRLASSLAVTFDRISQRLLQQPQMATLAKSNPEAFKATVFGLAEELGLGGQNSIQMPRAAENENPLKGPEKWVNDGVDNLLRAGVEPERLDELRKTVRGRNLIIEASGSLGNNSMRMDSVIRRIRTASGQGGL